MNPYQRYPKELRDAEAEAVRTRRCKAAVADSGEPVGLALSGGGIRSATFSLGFLQGLATRKLLRRIDFLSTVSGGGYIGGFLGRFYDRFRNSTVPASSAVEDALTDPRSPELNWLRSHGEFIAPAGKEDLQIALAIFLRNFLTLQFVLGMLVFTLFGLANIVRYKFFERASGLLMFAGLGWRQMPIGHFITGGVEIFWSPWFVLVEWLILLFVLPYAIGYWLASQDDSESYTWPPLLLAFLGIGAALFLGLNNGFKPWIVLWSVPILLSFVAVEDAWYKVRQDNQSVGTGGPAVEHLRARAHLTHDLGMWLAILGMALGFALLDTIGHALYEYSQHNSTFVRAFTRAGIALAALLPILRGAARLVANFQSKEPNPGRLASLLATPAASAVLAVLLLAPPLILVSFASHGVFGGGENIGRGTGITVATLVVSLVLASSSAMLVVNRCSLNGSYSVRLARAFLGASNPLRIGRVKDDVMPGDDVASMPLYRPHEAGGPLHLINVCVNETIEQLSQRAALTRRGEVVSVSPLGITVGLFWHALWNPRRAQRDAEGVHSRRWFWSRHKREDAEKDRPITTIHDGQDARDADSQTTLWVVGQPPFTRHPLLAADNMPPDRFEILPLRDWISISGAAFGPGMGKSTNPALSVLLTLANLRTGYWWDSGLTSGVRGTRPQVYFVRRLLYLLPKLFKTQFRLVDESLARFPGPWERHWYLSDGGHFENLGGYELVRRRVPYIIIVDSTADADYDFGDFATFQRLIRIDFQAEIEPFGKENWETQVNALLGNQASVAQRAYWNDLRNQIALGQGEGGPFDALTTPKGREGSGRRTSFLKKHAALFRIRYSGTERTSILLYVKASMDGREPADLHHYHIEHPDFPHQSTADQFFDEAQWECYRRLGEHVADDVLGSSDARIPFWLTQLKL